VGNFHVDFNASATLRKWPSINAQRNASAEHHWKGSVAMSLLIVLGAMLPLVVVGVTNLILTFLVPRAYGAKHEVVLGGHPIVTQIGPVAAIWAVEGALLLGIATVFVFAWRPVLAKFADGRRRLPGLCLRRSIPRPSMGSVG